MQAEDYHAGFVAAFEKLGSGERSGRAADVPGAYLKYAIGSHLVFYRETESEIIVVRILHQRMDVGRHLE